MGKVVLVVLYVEMDPGAPITSECMVYVAPDNGLASHVTWTAIRDDGPQVSSPLKLVGGHRAGRGKNVCVHMTLMQC